MLLTSRTQKSSKVNHQSDPPGEQGLHQVWIKQISLDTRCTINCYRSQVSGHHFVSATSSQTTQYGMTNLTGRSGNQNTRCVGIQELGTKTRHRRAVYFAGSFV